jgi:hypothetical protein
MRLPWSRRPCACFSGNISPHNWPDLDKGEKLRCRLPVDELQQLDRRALIQNHRWQHAFAALSRTRSTGTVFVLRSY